MGYEYTLDMQARRILAKNLRALMDARGLTQMQVAKAGGVSQASVSLALRGEKSQQLDIVEGLARGVGVTVGDLLSATAPGATTPDVSRLLDAYASLPEDRREYILRVLDDAARYVAP